MSFQVALQHQSVASAVAIMQNQQILILFITLNTTTNDVPNFSTPAADYVDSAVEAAAKSEVNVIGQIQQLIRCSLLSQYVPDEVLVVEKFPMTSHGEEIFNFELSGRLETKM